MLHSEHRILSLQNSEERSRRMMGWAMVGLIHVLVIWALVSGLAIKVVHAFVPPPITTTILPDKLPPMTAPKVEVVTPGPLTLDPVPPTWTTISDPLAPPLTPTPAPPGTPDTGVQGLSGTHTIPPYPGLELRLGHEGVVQLHLSISAAGDVTAASVIRSSGYPALDQTAVSWVIAHWKYQPATRNGASVAGVANAAVVFDVKNAQ